MLSLILSTITFLLASYFIRRYLDDADIPKSLTRTALIFVLALACSYVVAALVDWVGS
jgi:hypothetical protein